MSNVLLIVAIALLLFCIPRVYCETKVLNTLMSPRSIITFMFYGAATYLALKQLPLPGWLENLIFAMQGFWFGTKTVSIQKNGGQ